MGLLSAESIKASKPKLVAVPVPEWGGPDAEVMVRTMSGSARFAYENHLDAHPGLDVRARVAAFTLCDSEGVLLFTPDDIESLSQTDSVALDRVFWKAFELSALGRKQVAELEKN